MKTWQTIEDVKAAGKNIFSIENQKFSITNEEEFRKTAVDHLIWNALFTDDVKVKELARWIIWEASQTLNCPASSIHDFYMARAGDNWEDCTTPAINIRTMTYDTARTIFQSLQKLSAGACVFEIAKSEVTYTMQSPSEYASCILAAALRENYRGPVFIQGDHFQVNAKKYHENPEKEIEGLKALIRDAIHAGFYNIDIDASTTVDLSKKTLLEQQRTNFEITAQLTKFIRTVEPNGITVSVGAEIGEVGTKNSTVEELTAFMEGYNGALSLGREPTGMSKISVQSGTTHGGVVLPDGSIAKVKIDFDTLESLGKAAREQFRVGGVVQHGASTLPQSAFDNFPKRQTLEIHLATAFQNLVYDSETFPVDLKKNIYTWLEKNCADERKADWTNEQFYYKTRKKGFAPFKKELWSLDESVKTALKQELSEMFEQMFESLGIEGSQKTVSKFTKVTPIHKPCPVAMT